MSEYVGTVKGLGVGAIVAVLIAALYLSGCATQTGLFNRNVERVCTNGVCFLRASADIVDRRCRGKGGGTWDDGLPRFLGDGRRARCCTVWAPGRKRFRIWVAEGDEECIPHEVCHIDQYLSPRPDHSKCHDFGFGKSKGRPK